MKPLARVCSEIATRVIVESMSGSKVEKSSTVVERSAVPSSRPSQSAASATSENCVSRPPTAVISAAESGPVGSS